MGEAAPSIISAASSIGTTSSPTMANVTAASARVSVLLWKTRIMSSAILCRWLWPPQYTPRKLEPQGPPRRNCRSIICLAKTSRTCSEMFNEALALSDGAVGRGWNNFIARYYGNVNDAGLLLYPCDYDGTCPPCWNTEELYGVTVCVSYGEIEW